MGSNPMTNVDTVYVVQSGDTLSGIAQSYGMTATGLAQLNGLSNPDWLQIGQRLVVRRNGSHCAVVPLFIDRDRNPIEGLVYRLESAGVAAFEGISQLNGLGERFVANAENDLVKIYIRKRDGTWKLIHQTEAWLGEKLITLRSGVTKFSVQTKPHPQTVDHTPVSDPPSSRRPRPSPPGTPARSRGDMQHPAAHGSDKGTKAQPTTTPEGLPGTSISKDLPDLRPYFALYTGDKIREVDWKDASDRLGCEIPLIQAFAHVETMKAAFDKYHRPTILYERQVFSRHTNHRFDATNADISSQKAYTNRKFDKAGNPIPLNDQYGAHQYERFERAWLLDEDAAIQACSWGKFQVLGENWKALQFQTTQQFLQAACTSEREHLLKLFVPFAMNKHDTTHGTLRNALIQKNWINAAYLYNGPGYKKYDYDNKLRMAYEKIKAGTLHV